MRVVRWIPYSEAKGIEEAVGGAGGIDKPLSREDFLETWNPETHPYIEAIWAALDECGAMSGQAHQERGCPVFDDGKVATFSMRGWGDLVAAWHNSRRPGEPRTYIHYAWDLP